MDKELIAGLSNLSESLDRISEALSKKGEAKSASATALQMGEFDKQVREISNSITEVKKDTQKLLDQQDTILKILKRKEKDSKVEAKKEKVKDISQEPTPVKVSKDKKAERDEKDRDGGKVKKVSSGKPATEEVSKDKKDEKKPGFFGDMDTKKIKDGISTVLLIVTGIIAIGLALKIVGKVDFLSVMTLALALPLIAFAFEKISKVNVDRKKIPDMILALVGFSTAIALSSYILSMVRPVGLFQAITAILISGVFTVIAPNLGKLVNGLKGVNLLTMAKAVIFLPIILVSLSIAIMMSSRFLSQVKPIGLFQAFSAIMIAGVFSVISYGMGKLLSAFKGLNPLTAIMASALLPIVLIAVSFAIMASSVLLSRVKPIGLFQAITSILIAAVFAVISYGIGKMLAGFKGIDPLTAAVASALIPIVLIALSFSIMVSSAFLSRVKPIGLFQAISSIFIAATFVVLSYAVAKILPAFRKVSYADAAKASVMMPLLFTGMSIAIMLSSYPLSAVKPIGLFQFLTSIGIAILFVAFAYAIKLIVNATKNISTKDVISSFVKLTIMTAAIALTGYIINKMPDISLAKTLRAIVFTGGLVVISYLFKGVIKATDGMSATGLFKTAIKLSLIIGAIVAAGYLVNKMPSINLARVAQFTALSIALAFVTIIMAGVVKVLDKIGLSSIIKGGIAIVALAGVIMVSSILLSKGRYNKYPNYKWSLSVALSLGIFGVAAFLLGTQAMNPMFYAGMGIIVALSGVIVIASFVLSTGKYDKYPTPSWSLGVGMSLAAFGLGAVLLGTQVFNPFFYAGLGMILVVAASVVATSYILDAGKYDKYPSFGWVGPTVLVLGAFGLVAVGLGIVSPLLLLGLPAMLGVAGTIYLVDKMFSNGTYKKYPTKDWVDPTISLIGKFSGMAILYAFGLPLIILGSLAILAIAGTIYLVDKVFKNGEFKKFPSDKWVTGVTKTMQSVSKLLQDIRKNLGFGDLVLGALKLLGTVYVIKKMDDAFSKGQFAKFPSKKWNDGVKYTIQTFMQLMKDKGFLTVIKERLGSALGGGLDDIAKIIVKIDSVLSKGQFNKFPSSDWSKNVISSLRLFKSLMGESSISGSIGQGLKNLFSGGEKSTSSLSGIAQQITSVSLILSKGVYDKFPSNSWTSTIQSLFIKFTSMMSIASKAALGGPALIMASNSIVAVDKILSMGKYTKYPSEKWIKSVVNTITKFGNLIIDVNKRYSSVQLIMGLVKVNSIVNFILQIDKNFEKGKYQKTPSNKWLKDSTNSILEYGRLAIRADKEFPIVNLLLGIFKINLIVNTLVSVDKKINSGAYQKFPNQNWINKTSSSIMQFGKLAIDSNLKFGLVGLMIGLYKVRKIADTIQYVSIALSKGNYTKFPNLQWASAVPTAIKGFMSFNFGLFSGILSLFKSDKAEKNELGKIVDLMLFVDKKFQSGNWQKFPSVQWVNGTILALQKFRSIVSLLSFSSFGDRLLSTFGAKNPIVTAVSNIEKLGVSFDKLAKSIRAFTESIKGIDGDKLAAIRSLSSNVVMMSLMDPAQFDMMMSKLEERSGVFGDLIKDFEVKKTKGESGGGGTGVSYNTKSTVAKTDKKSDSQILGEKLDLMNALLADISSVVGSRGSLKTYLNKIKDDVTIGGGLNTLTQRSDRRLKNIIKKTGVSDNGINIYLFTYTFDPSTVYQGVMAQELIGTQYESAVHTDKNGLYSVDYSLLDVDFKKTNV